jgi:hypothetical protein
MSLMKLLSMSKSFAGGRTQSGRYKIVDQGLLPKFAPVGRPVSLAPKRKSDGPPAKKEQSTTPMGASISLRENLFQVADPVTEPVKAVVATPRAAGCGNAVAAPTNWFRLGNNPFVNRPAGSPKPPTPAHAELSLDAVKPVRNDLSDSDLQIVPAKPEIKPDALNSPRPRLPRPELTGFAWSRLTARLFNSERVRA